MNNISIFLPLRGGSQRVKRKNTRQFHKDGRSLFQYKLAQVIEVQDEVSEIIISTNDKEIISQCKNFNLSDKIKLIRRPDQLCTSDTKVSDLIKHAVDVTSGNHIFWLHATSPFIDANDYRSAIRRYFRQTDPNGPDSLMSVNAIQQFIWDDVERRVINVDRNVNPWPNTQDLRPLYEINHAFYINSRKNYEVLNDRIGLKPELFLCEGLKKIDIDWQDDFELAQSLIEFYEQ